VKQFFCSKCGEKVTSEFLKSGEIYFHKECNGETTVPESGELEATEGIRARYEKFTAEKIVKVINQGMQADEFEIARDVLVQKLADTPKVAVKQNNEQLIRDNSTVTSNTDLNHVVVTDVRMTLGSMFIFSLKWVVASIPAIIIVYASFFLIGFMIGSW
jgi:hypothetical protein